MLDAVALKVGKLSELHLSLSRLRCFPFHGVSLKCATHVTVRPSEPCSACCVYSQQRCGNLLNPLEVRTRSLKQKRSTQSFRCAYTLTIASPSLPFCVQLGGSLFGFPEHIFPGDLELSGHRWRQGNLPFSSPSLFTI